VAEKEVLRKVEKWLTGEREQRMAWRGLGSQLSPNLKPPPRRASRKNSSGLACSVCEISRIRAVFRQSSQHSPSSSPISIHSSERSYSAQGHSYTVNPNTDWNECVGQERTVRGGSSVVSEWFNIDKYIICAGVCRRDNPQTNAAPQARTVPTKCGNSGRDLNSAGGLPVLIYSSGPRLRS